MAMLVFALMASPAVAIILKEAAVSNQTESVENKDWQKYIYSTFTNHNVYRQPLAGLSTAGNWQHVGRGNLIALGADGETLYGVGTNKKLYKQSFPGLSTSSHWRLAGGGSIKDIDVKDGVLYAVGIHGKIWSQKLRTLSTTSRWQKRTTAGRVESIAIHQASNMLYGVNANAQLWKIPLNELSKNGWVRVHMVGLCYYISISGDDLYCRGAPKASGEVWHQKLSLLTATSAWKKLAKGEGHVTSVFVPQGNTCHGTLIEKADDFACDKITSAKKCRQHYERSGKSDTYIQCAPSKVTKGSKIINCLATKLCTLP